MMEGGRRSGGDDGDDIFFQKSFFDLSLVMVHGLHEESAFARNVDFSDSVSCSLKDGKSACHKSDPYP